MDFGLNYFIFFYSMMTFFYVAAAHSRGTQIQKLDARIERLKFDLQSFSENGDQEGIHSKKEEIRFALAVKEKVTGWKKLEAIESEIRNSQS